MKTCLRSLAEQAREKTTQTLFSGQLERNWGWGMARWCEIVGSIEVFEVIGSLWARSERQADRRRNELAGLALAPEK